MLSSTVQSEAAAPYHLEEMDSPDITGSYGVRGQGPYVRLYAKLSDDVVKQAAFQTYSCPNAIACGSWVTRWVEGRDIQTLKLLTASDLMRVLAGFRLAKSNVLKLLCRRFGT